MQDGEAQRGRIRVRRALALICVGLLAVAAVADPVAAKKKRKKPKQPAITA